MDEQQPKSRRGRIVLTDPEQVVLPERRQVITDAMKDLPHDVRRRIGRMQFKQRQRSVQRVMSEADIPPGSVLSDATLQMIREGRLSLEADIPRSTTNRPTKQERDRQSRQDRLLKQRRTSG